MPGKRILTLSLAAVLFLVCLPGTVARAGFYGIESNVLPPIRVSPTGDVAVAVAIKGDTASLVSFSPTTGEQLWSEALGGYVVEIGTVRIGDSTRVVVLLSSGTAGLDALIYDVDTTGQLNLRADVSVLPVSYYYFARTLRCSSNGAFFLVALGSTAPYALYGFSLDNGVLLSETPLDRFTQIVDVVDGPHPMIRYLEFRPPVGGLRALDITDPTAPADAGVISWTARAGDGPTGISDVVTSADGRYMFIADNYTGLWTIDLDTRALVGHLLGPTQFAQVALHEKDGRRVLALSTWENVSYTEQTLLLVDATNPRNLQVFATRESPEPHLLFEFPLNGAQLVVSVSTAIYGLDAETLETIWTLPVEGANETDRPRLLAPFGAPGGVVGGWGAEDIFYAGGYFEIPEIAAISFVKRDLVVEGTGLDARAVVLVDGVAVRTVRAHGRLRGRKVLAHVAPGQTFRVQVRNRAGTISSAVEATAPLAATD